MLSIKRQSEDRVKPIPADTDLKFGQHFSDHWFLAKYREGEGWYESTIAPYGALPLDPAASVLHYGQALFEGMKAFRQDDGRTVLFRPEFNWQRMSAGAERLCLPAPPKELFLEGVRELVKVDQRWVPQSEGCSLYIRPTLIGSEGFLGVRPSREAMFFILLSPVGSYYGGQTESVRIYVEENSVRAVPGGLGATKAGANYAASLQAGLRAKQNGFAQVLWLDALHEGIEEVGTMNVFFVFQDEVVTPALNGSILAGGVRDCALQLLKHFGRKVTERRITIQEVLQRHAKNELLEVFGTGTAAVISPVGELNYRGKGHIINEQRKGPIAGELLDAIVAIQRGKQKDPFNWISPI